MDMSEILYKRWGVSEISDAKVAVSKEVFEAMVCLALGRFRFSEADYLSRYPDVKRAIENGQFLSAWHHFVWAGVVEGRQLTDPDIDAANYLEMNPDLGGAFDPSDEQGVVNHWRNIGWLEARLYKPQVV